MGEGAFLFRSNFPSFFLGGAGIVGRGVGAKGGCDTIFDIGVDVDVDVDVCGIAIRSYLSSRPMRLYPSPIPATAAINGAQ